MPAASSLHLESVGSRDEARAVFGRFFRGSSAYRAYLGAQGLASSEVEADALPWERIPLLTKKGFYAAKSWRDLVPEEARRDVFAVIRSSGSTSGGAGGGFFWPQLKSSAARLAPLYADTLIQTFALRDKGTLVITGLSMGSWAGGEQFSFMFKSLALRPDLRVVVFSPGNQHAEILEIIEACHEDFEQIIVGLCPSAIFYLERLAQQKGQVLPLAKMRFWVTGEPFPEAMRLDLQARSGAREPSMLSVYGSADTGVIGVESPALIRLRQELSANSDWALELGMASRLVPNLYHLVPGAAYYERVADELVVTQWQGVPLVRYNLQDRARLFSWKELRAFMSAKNPAQSAFWENKDLEGLPDVVSVEGRSQGCVFLCGSNIFESMIQESFALSRLETIGSGHFVCWTEIEQGQQVLCWQIELKDKVPRPSATEELALKAELVDALGRQQPEFAEDYDKFYKPFEGQGLHIFRLHFCEAPHLAAHPKLKAHFKRKTLIDHGPL
jgi:phenylacetate-CoA ligase